LVATSEIPEKMAQISIFPPVSGLLTGAAVLFNGIRVGEVTDLRLDTNNPQLVNATIAIAASAPVRADTKAGLDFQDLTGVPVITLQGGSTPLGIAQKSSHEPYILVADPLAGQSITGAARDALRRLDTILADNSEPIRNTMANVSTSVSPSAVASGPPPRTTSSRKPPAPGRSGGRRSRHRQ
jgi:phospholipid/cholesterol/gamma-HCH transport system substrate-binding protein